MSRGATKIRAGQHTQDKVGDFIYEKLLESPDQYNQKKKDGFNHYLLLGPFTKGAYTKGYTPAEHQRLKKAFGAIVAENPEEVHLQIYTGENAEQALMEAWAALSPLPERDPSPQIELEVPLSPPLPIDPLPSMEPSWEELEQLTSPLVPPEPKLLKTPREAWIKEKALREERMAYYMDWARRKRVASFYEDATIVKKIGPEIYEEAFAQKLCPENKAKIQSLHGVILFQYADGEMGMAEYPEEMKEQFTKEWKEMQKTLKRC